MPGSITTACGKWNAPARFLPLAVLIPVLPPMAASTWPVSVVGTAIQRTPRRYVAATKPATSVVEPPPNPTMVPRRSIGSSPQSRSTTARLFAASPAGTVPAWRPPSGAGGATSTRSSADDRVGLDVVRGGQPNAQRGEQDVVGVSGHGVRGLRVDALARVEERPEVLLVAGERAVGVADALPCRGHVDLQEHGERAVREPLAVDRRERRRRRRARSPSRGPSERLARASSSSRRNSASPRSKSSGIGP